MTNDLVKKLQEIDLFTPPSAEDVASRGASRPVSIHTLFDKLVGPSGKAETVEGELVRAIARLHYRYLNDGDYFYKGYGKETAGPAARFLKAKANQLNIPALKQAFTLMTSRRETDAEQFEGGPYQLGLEAAEKAILDYVVSKNNQYTPNEEDMLES